MTSLNFDCKKCKSRFDAEVEIISFSTEGMRPRFEKNIICPQCGSIAIEDVLLTELGQLQLNRFELRELRRFKLAREVALLDRQIEDNSHNEFWQSISGQLHKNFFSIVTPVLIIVLTLVSTLMVEYFKGLEATARDRQRTFEVISQDLGHYVFMGELEQEFMENNWTSLAEKKPITEEYNKIVSKLRENEFKNEAIITKYWDNESAVLFSSVMSHVKISDSAVHGLNEEMGLVIRAAERAGTNTPSAKERADPTVATKVAGEIQHTLLSLKQSIKKLLDNLSAKL